MEPLTTFTDEEVLGDDTPSNWQLITLSTLKQLDQGGWRERSHSRNCRAHARGSFMAASSAGKSEFIATTGTVSPSPAPI